MLDKKIVEAYKEIYNNPKALIKDNYMMIAKAYHSLEYALDHKRDDYFNEGMVILESSLSTLNGSIKEDQLNLALATYMFAEEVYVNINHKDVKVLDEIQSNINYLKARLQQV